MEDDSHKEATDNTCNIRALAPFWHFFVFIKKKNNAAKICSFIMYYLLCTSFICVNGCEVEKAL